MDFGPGDLRTLKAKENNRHQAPGDVPSIASLIRFERLFATATRAGLGMSRMTCVDPRSCANPAGKSFGVSSRGTACSSLVLSFVSPSERACEREWLVPRQMGQCQMVRARACATVSLAHDVCHRTEQPSQTIAAFRRDWLSQDAQDASPLDVVGDDIE